MSTYAEERKLAAITLTDMVGYSALSRRDDKLAVELLEEHREILRKIFREFNGTECVAGVNGDEGEAKPVCGTH
jgi:class 3 adenylate cyclase